MLRNSEDQILNSKEPIHHGVSNYVYDLSLL
jgi:hypothetical protein